MAGSPEFFWYHPDTTSVGSPDSPVSSTDIQTVPLPMSVQ